MFIGSCFLHLYIYVEFLNVLDLKNDSGRNITPMVKLSGLESSFQVKHKELVCDILFYINLIMGVIVHSNGICRAFRHCSTVLHAMLSTCV